MQEKRVIEYVALGDFATAVGFLLASTPEKSARYYRDALCTLALAVLLLCCLTLSLCRSVSVHAVFCQAIGLYPCLLLHTQLLSILRAQLILEECSLLQICPLHPCSCYMSLLLPPCDFVCVGEPCFQDAEHTCLELQ